VAGRRAFNNEGGIFLRLTPSILSLALSALAFVVVLSYVKDGILDLIARLFGSL